MSRLQMGRRRLGTLAFAFAMATAATGCQSGAGPWTRWIQGRNQTSPAPDDVKPGDLLGRYLQKDEDEQPSRFGGLTLGASGWSPLKKTVTDEKLAADFAAAEKLYLQGDLDGAKSGFAAIARKQRSPKAMLFGDAKKTNPGGGSPLTMKSLYYLGEIHFQQGNYVAAHDRFEELIKEFPGTNYLDKAVERENQIGLAWMAYATGKEVEPTARWSRFRGRLPLVDTGGHAVAALDHVRMNDPTGPLADDAVMSIARYHADRGDYEAAAIHFDQLVSDHPKSPLMHEALTSSIDSKIKGYLGPEYDVTGLEQARETVHRTMQLFPERLASTEDPEKNDLYKTLDVIADQEAERAYSVGSYYKRAGKVISSEYYFGMIVQKWPKTKWAEKAQVHLVELAKLPHKESLPSKIMGKPGTDPYNSGMSSGSMTSGGGMPMLGATGP
jgi:outer membrane protein assembly factor BamD (BamD/ComL family)